MTTLTYVRPVTFSTQTITPYFLQMDEGNKLLPYMLILMGEEKAHGRSGCSILYGKSKYPTLKQSICYLFIQDESSTTLKLMQKIQSLMSLVSTIVLTLFFFFSFYFSFLFYNTLSCQLRSGKTKAIYLRKVCGPYYYSGGE